MPGLTELEPQSRQHTAVNYYHSEARTSIASFKFRPNSAGASSRELAVKRQHVNTCFDLLAVACTCRARAQLAEPSPAEPPRGIRSECRTVQKTCAGDCIKETVWDFKCCLSLCTGDGQASTLSSRQRKATHTQEDSR